MYIIEEQQTKVTNIKFYYYYLRARKGINHEYLKSSWEVPVLNQCTLYKFEDAHFLLHMFILHGTGNGGVHTRRKIVRVILLNYVD